MRTARNAAGAFALRLATIIVDEDADDPDIAIGTDEVWSVTDDGRLTHDTTGAEAVLIVRGPAAGRKAALRQLLARLDT